MKCSKCNTENKEGRKFCSKCGSKLENVCPKCGYKNDPDDAFCGECGTELVATGLKPVATEITIPKLEDMHSQLQSLIPDILAQRYLSAEQQAGENRPITALFADISGFTPLSATRSSEAMFHLVQDCFKQLVGIVASYEGSISGFRGDGLLALFGAPIIHENDAERAILSAIDMRNTMRDRQLEISVGINTATMTVGEIQTELHKEYTAYSIDINLAKRLQESAKPGQILVGTGTYRLTRRAFDFEELSSLKLKGFVNPVTAYSLEKIKARPEKLRGIEGMRARMIGRDEEFEKLIDSTQEWLDGRGQIVSIIGEAGIGKSRLVSELKSYLAEKHTPNPSQEGNCLSSSESCEGNIQIVVSSGHDLYGKNHSAPRLLREISGDFIMETLVSSGDDGKRSGGLLIWKDEKYFIRFEVPSTHIWESSIYYGANIADRFIHPGVHFYDKDKAWLRLERKGDRFTGYVSSDGENWYRCGWADIPMEDPIKVGIHALCSGSPATSTRFEYFKIYRK